MSTVKAALPLKQGFTLLEGIIALSVLMGLLILGNHYTRQRLEDALQQQAAAHLRVVTAAAVRYVQDCYDNLGTPQERDDWKQEQQQLPATQSPVSLEVWRYQRLMKQGYLQLLDQRNVYGQGYALYLEDKPAENSEKPQRQLLLLTTGGRTLHESALRSIARQLGSQGGYLSKKPPRMITGSQQGWQLPLPSETLYQPVSNPKPADLEESYEKPGHLATLSYIDPDDIVCTDNLLHRKQQVGKPQLNQMETDLAMQQHHIIFTGETAEESSRLSAQGIACKQGEHTIEFGVQAKKAQLTLNDSQGSVVMDATRVTTTKPSIVDKTTVIGYSAPELHAYWNKVPYYELSAKKDEGQVKVVADQVCSKPATSQETALGRLLMLGQQGSETTFLYLCSHAPSNAVTAHLISQFPPKAPKKRIRVSSANSTPQNSRYLQVPDYSKNRSPVSPSSPQQRWK